MNDSNNTLRYSRTSQEAFGYRLQSHHFPPKDPDIGDKAVAVTCIVIAILLPVSAYLFKWQIGG